ncbi:peptidylprolyl isomerase [Terricaulis sp.]|uniref:peptidylprolyl isomerase n=1 Tax=Terricaulis sp. TaxID=2768686 RepID=UPI003782DE73
MKHTLIRTVSEDSPAASFSGCSHGPMPAARRAANAPPIFVNGESIPETAIAQEAQNHKAASGAEARAAAARALVIRELLVRRAQTLGLEPAPLRDEAGREETAEESLVRQVLEREAPAQEPTEEECRRVYAANPRRFAIPEVYEAAHILVAPDDGSDAEWSAAYERAQELISRLSAQQDFADLARVFSHCPSGADGGALGQLQRGDLAPELEEVLLALAPGAVSPAPVRTRYGWHVVRLDRRRSSHTAPFEAVRTDIREVLRTRASVAAAASYVSELAAAANIEGLTFGFGAAP